MPAASVSNPWPHCLLLGGERRVDGVPMVWRLGDRRRSALLTGSATCKITQPATSRRCRPAFRCCAGEAAGEEANPDADDPRDQPEESSRSLWSKLKTLGRVDTAEMRSRIAKLGLAAVLAYGLFDGVTYTSFFVLAFLGYEKSTGKNPAANLKALIGIVILMWTGNNVTRPFRVAGAAALAPVVDEGLKKLQNYFSFPSPIYAFALVVGIVATSCFAIVGMLVLSRWGR